MQKGFTVYLTESKKPLEDILIPAKNRHGYLGGEVPVIPIYFYRCVGIAGLDSLHQDAFYNQIYLFNESVGKSTSGYLNFTSSISMPNNDEIENIVSQVRTANPSSSKTLKDSIVSQIIKSGALRMFRSSAFNHNAISAFEQVFDLYMRNERNINESKAENFALKMLVWLKRYQGTLIKESTPSDVPKVLFYGDIKLHEVYFLTLLALIGCDIIFIHTDKQKDKLFEDVDKKGQFSKKIEMPDSVALEPFPMTERAIQKSTVAYNASKEIQSKLYGADVGLFKAWQYESGNTKPIMLKTTYEEFKILWHEGAKIRPEFEVRDERVYVPNLFAKINGTQGEISDYWRDIHRLTKEEYTALYKQMPFSVMQYSKQEMFATAYLFNRDGILDKQSLIGSPVYKLQYLKASIQDFIISKINELIVSKIFIQEIDEKMRLKILMTVITMDKELLRLIESFDYTGKVPKILLYSGDRSVLSEEDTILLAFFHLIGADIAIFTPTNYLNVELWIKPEYFTTHQLPSVQFDMEFQSNTLQEAKTGLRKFRDKLMEILKL